MKEFYAVFQMSRTIIFEVRYCTIGNNPTPDFATSAAQYARNKRDYTRCGQAQPDLLKGYRTAMAFFKKWDAHHLHTLTPEQYAEMRADLEALQSRYNYILTEAEEGEKMRRSGYGFYQIAEWTKQPPKK